jgi:hypothetical protein
MRVETPSSRIHFVPPHIGHILASSVTSRPTSVSLAPALSPRSVNADALEMAFAPRYSVSIMVVVGATLATLAVFTFARPQYHPRYESKMIDFSKQNYVSPGTVRVAFAKQGIRLKTSSAFEFTLLHLPRAVQADDLQVVVGPRTGTGSFGPKLESYDNRFDNVMVTYGGHDEQLLQKVKAAVASLH